jgi:hypothetical protein
MHLAVLIVRRYAVAAPFLDAAAFDAAAAATPEGSAAETAAGDSSRQLDDSAQCHHRQQPHKASSAVGAAGRAQQQGLRDSADELLPGAVHHCADETMHDR